jgi:adenylylsulfate kinase-like enzyme
MTYIHLTLTGPAGCGKTTLRHLLTDLFDKKGLDWEVLNEKEVKIKAPLDYNWTWKRLEGITIIIREETEEN